MRVARPFALFVAGALVLGLAGCGGAADDSAGQARALARPVAAGSDASASRPSSAHDSKGKGLAAGQHAKKAVRPPDRLAPRTIRPVKRNGKVVRPTVAAHSASFHEAVRYTDGVVLKVTGTTEGKMTGLAPGVYPGRPMSTFALTLTNGSRKPIRLGGVVLTMTYGQPARLAPHIYADGSKDFSGVVKPGKSTNATYSFSVPLSDLDDVTMSIDLDGVHKVASFHGSLQ